MNENEKYFLNSLGYRLVPRCALLLSVVGAYNGAYEENGSARRFPKLPTLRFGNFS